MAEPFQTPRLDSYAQDLLRQSYGATPISPDILAQYGQGMAQQVQPPPQVQQYSGLRPSQERQQYIGLIEQRMNELAQAAGGMQELIDTGIYDQVRQKAERDVKMLYGDIPEIQQEPRVIDVQGNQLVVGGPVKMPIVLPTEEEKLAKNIGVKKSMLDLQEAQQKLELTRKEAQVKDLDRALKLQSSMASSAMALNMIDSLLTDPELVSGVGWNSALGMLPETKAKEIKTKIDQIKGDVFLKAFESLKGGGQITEIEGKKAEASLQRLDPALYVDDFKKALLELRGTYIDFSSRAATGLQGFVPQEQAQPSAPQMAPSPTPPAEPVRVSSPDTIPFVRDPETGRMIRQQ
jgi:hypothetical protein